jgi:uncharacterized protein YndB with AHSA1/START domain
MPVNSNPRALTVTLPSDHEILDGTEHGFRGEYRDIAPPERLVYTFEYEGLPGHVAVETLTFHEANGKTILTSRMEFETNQERDGMLKSGMENGASQTMDRLAAYLELLSRGK